MSPCTTRPWCFCQTRVRAPWGRRTRVPPSHPATAQCSGLPSKPKLGEGAREVCVARWYDPVSGQFLSLDPLVGLTQAPYRYVGDDPANEEDPLGLVGEPFGGARSRPVPSSMTPLSPCGHYQTVPGQQQGLRSVAFRSSSTAGPVTQRGLPIGLQL